MMVGIEFNAPTPGPEASKTNFSGGLQLVESLIDGLERYRRQPSSDVVPNLLDAKVATAFRQDTKDS
jgi:hypothetical protein